jgi:PAS domain S-box-containing protein
VTVLAIAAVYFVAARLGLSMAFLAPQVSPVWPPTGLALVALVRFGLGAWPGIALGAFAANAMTSAPPGIALGIAAGNTLEAVLAVWLLQRLGFRPTLERLRDVLGLAVIAAAGSTAVSATVGVTSLCLGGVQPWTAFLPLWWVWWIGDAMGDLVMAPVLLVWAFGRPTWWPSRRFAEAIALLAGTLAVGVVVFAAASTTGYPLHYMIFPFVVAGALRFGQVGTTMLTFLVSALAVGSTLVGRGPFASGTANEELVLLQLFLAVVAMTGLLLAAAIRERDAAERRRADDFLRLEVGEERLRLALTAGHMGVWDWNIPTGEVKWSENLESIHGLAPGTFDGTLTFFRNLVHPDDQARVEAAITSAVEGGPDYDVEFRNLWPDGSVHWMAAKGRVLRDRSGWPVRMLGVGMDVTERKRLEEELREHAARLAEADRRKDEFLAMLAHELRNPLAPILNGLELLRLARDNPEDVERSRAVLERQIRHVVRLVDDLLDVSRITWGKIALQMHRVDLAQIIADAVDIARPHLDGRRHRLKVDVPPEPLWLDADATRLAEVVANLLDNAAKYTPEGGAISVLAERDGKDVVVRVRDTGAGMSAEVLARAFDLFAQGEPTLDRAHGGLGIGLTLVRRLVELHGGTVSATSEGAGRGTEVSVRLPAASGGPAPRPVRESRAATIALAQGQRVLVVDDNVDAAESLMLLLGAQGYDVSAAHSGPAALEEAGRVAPDFILLDIGLPGMDGYAVAQALRRDPRLARCRLVAVTGYGRDEDRRRSRDAGFDCHLVKPVDPVALRALLTKYAAETLTRARPDADDARPLATGRRPAED